MQYIGAFEAKNTLGSLLDRVEKGEEIVITRHGKPVARMVQPAAAKDPQKALATLAAFRNQMQNFNDKASGHKAFDWSEWKAYRDEGRK